MEDDRPDRTERIFYVRDGKRQPVGCVAYSAIGETTAVAYGYSALHPGDRFDRSRARRIALGRLRANRVTVDLDGDRPLERVVRALIEDRGVPNRVRRELAARLRERRAAAAELERDALIAEINAGTR